MPAATMRRGKCFNRDGTSKYAHPDEEDAERVRQTRIAGGSSPGSVGVYWCTNCNQGFHVGCRPRSRNEHRFQGTKRSKKGSRR